MDRTSLTLLIVAALIVVFCVPLARSSNRRDQIYGGAAARFFHFIGAAAYVGVLPSALFGSFLVGPLKLGIPLALGLLAISLLALLLYAVFEQPARAKRVPEKERGWTAEDALKSGL
ncbi:MAG: hypothetical protein HXY41_00665 [Chloroflexi bacterium]|nr:hypothetical protein [Chloroflexota bacterium]